MDINGFLRKGMVMIVLSIHVEKMGNKSTDIWQGNLSFIQIIWKGNAIDKVNSLKKNHKEVNYVIVQSDGFAYY